MSWVWWVVLAWPLLAVAGALLLGRGIRLRDRREVDRPGTLHLSSDEGSTDVPPSAPGSAGTPRDRG